jgi:hypothetical protein
VAVKKDEKLRYTTELIKGDTAVFVTVFIESRKFVLFNKITVITTIKTTTTSTTTGIISQSEQS